MNDFLILPGHHLYKMDYQTLLDAHRKAGSDITVVALSADRAGDRNPGLITLKLNSQNEVLYIDSREVTDRILPLGVCCFVLVC